MKSYIIFSWFVFIGFVVNAQKSAMTSKKDSDPKAKQILDKLKKQFDGYKSMEVAFEMELELPNQPIEKQIGSIIQDQNKYVVKMKDQEIYADGKTVWIYLKKNKEVQISDFDESASSEFMSPKQKTVPDQKMDFMPLSVLVYTCWGGVLINHLDARVLIHHWMRTVIV